jgi:hypothetical protein
MRGWHVRLAVQTEWHRSIGVLPRVRKVFDSERARMPLPRFSGRSLVSGLRD